MLYAPCTHCASPLAFDAFFTWAYGDPLCSEACLAQYRSRGSVSVGTVDVSYDRERARDRAARLRGKISQLRRALGLATEAAGRVPGVAITARGMRRQHRAEDAAEEALGDLQALQHEAEADLVALARWLMALHAHAEPTAAIAVRLVEEHGDCFAAPPHHIGARTRALDAFLAEVQSGV